jgi:hypothetical protein
MRYARTPAYVLTPVMTAEDVTFEIAFEPQPRHRLRATVDERLRFLERRQTAGASRVCEAKCRYSSHTRFCSSGES